MILEQIALGFFIIFGTFTAFVFILPPLFYLLELFAQANIFNLPFRWIEYWLDKIEEMR
jgi:hypothetical protein